MQHPNRCPPTATITNTPRRQPLGTSTLPPPQDFGGHPQQSQRFVGPLHLTYRETGQLSKPGIGRPAVAAGLEVGMPRPGGRDRQERSPAHAPVAHLRPNCLVAQVKGDSHSQMNPTSRSPGPTRHTQMDVLGEFKVDELVVPPPCPSGRATCSTPARGHHPRPGADHPATAFRAAATLVRAPRMLGHTRWPR